MGDVFAIAAVDGRPVLNSHHQWTFEFDVELTDGRHGHAAAPKGETPSISERARDASAPHFALEDARALLVGRTLSQEAVDALLLERQPSWGASAVYALSVACFEATRAHVPGTPDEAASASAGEPPRILFNLLNGGMHAYTNPITSDLTEFLVAPRGRDTAAAIDGYARLLEVTRARLSQMPERRVGGNRVADLGPHPNEAACALVLDLLDEAGLTGQFALMVDASAGDWVRPEGYVLPVTEQRMDTKALVDYWLGLIDRFGLELIEDPLGELDVDGWQTLHRQRPSRAAILGDNFTSSDPAQLGDRAGHLDGVLLKPDQAGTVTQAFSFGEQARQLNLQLIASHRSIETDSMFLVHLATRLQTDWIKIGPYSDFSSVMRTNELLRSSTL
jgi:enolase